MRHQSVDRTGQMDVFVKVVELGGFSAAARQMKIAPSTVSKLIGRLESRLKTRLFQRSTRQLKLTPEGRAFFIRCQAILNEITAAEEEAAAGEVPTGMLRISVNVPAGRRFILPAIAGFSERYPQVCLDLILSDVVDDLVSDSVDIAIRTGPLHGDSLIARKLGESAMVVVGSPGYLGRRGRPETVSDLDRQICLDFTFARAAEGWPFRVGGEIRRIRFKDRIRASDGEAVRQLALGGAGLARLARFQVDDDLKDGRLEAVMEPLNPGDNLALYAVFTGDPRHIPPRTRAFLDYLTETVRIA